MCILYNNISYLKFHYKPFVEVVEQQLGIRYSIIHLFLIDTLLRGCLNHQLKIYKILVNQQELIFFVWPKTFFILRMILQQNIHNNTSKSLPHDSELLSVIILSINSDLFI